MPPIYSTDLAKTIAREYDDGLSMKELAEKHGLPKSAVRLCVLVHSKPRPQADTRTKLTPEQKVEITREYTQTRVTLKELASRYGVGYQTIHNIVMEMTKGQYKKPMEMIGGRPRGRKKTDTAAYAHLYLSGMSPQEVAAAMDVSVATARGHIRRHVAITAVCGYCGQEYEQFDTRQYCSTTCASANQRDRWLQSQYGLTTSDYETMYENQSGKCAICDTPSEKLVVDHNHQTGTVRGLLCPTCNMGIGLLKENPQVMANAIMYLGV